MRQQQSLNPELVQDKYKTVTAMQEHAREATKNLNAMSEQYRSTNLSIDEKVILLSAGSISLLLTFIGILFNSSRHVSSLHYVFVVLAITSWLLSIIFLLVSRWNLATYLFSTVHGHYLKALEQKTKAEIDFYKIYPNIVDPDTLEKLTDPEIVKTIQDGESFFKAISDQAGKTESIESLHSKLNKVFSLAGYVCFVGGYTLAFIFFLGVINLMNQ